MAHKITRSKRSAAKKTSTGPKKELKAAAVVVDIKITLEVALVAFWSPPSADTREAI